MVFNSNQAKLTTNTNPTSSGDIRYSLSSKEKATITQEDVQALRSIGRKNVNDFTQAEIDTTEKWARKYKEELGVKSPFFRAWFGDWREHETNPVNKVISSSKTTLKAGKAVNRDTNKTISWGVGLRGESSIHAVKDKIAVEAVYDIADIVEKAVYFGTSISELNSKSKMPNTAFMHSFYTVYENNEGTHLLKLFVEEALANNEKEVFTRAYELKDIQRIADVPRSVHSKKGGLTDGKSATVNSICDLFQLVKTYDKDFSYRPVSKYVLNEDGTPKVFYHQTEGDFDAFDLHRKGATKSDFETPNGIFLKETNRDIGLNSKKQVELYATIKSPLVFANREDARTYWSNNIKGYSGVVANLAQNDVRYGELFDEAFSEERLAKRKDVNELAGDDIYEKSERESQRILDEWQSADSKLSSKAKELVNSYLSNSMFDGVLLKEDKGSFGRKVSSLIVLQPTQVKSATNNIGTYSRFNDKIKYAINDPVDLSTVKGADIEDQIKMLKELVQYCEREPTKE